MSGDKRNTRGTRNSPSGRARRLICLRSSAIGAALGAVGVLSFAGGSARGNIMLFTTSSDFTGWTSGSATAAVSTTFDYDGVTTNGAGNNPQNSGGSINVGGTSPGGSLQLTTTSSLGYNILASSANEAYNDSFMQAIDPGATTAYSAASSYGAGSTVAYSGTMLLTYTVPTISSGNYIQIGIFTNDAADGYYHPQLPTGAVSDGTVNGQSTYTASIPYTIAAGAGNLTNLNFSVFSNSNYVPTSPFYVDSIQVMTAVTTGPVSANWITNGSGAWENNANWNPSEPQAPGDTATFDDEGGTITVSPTVTLSTPVSLTSITFNTSNVSYTINGNGSSGRISVAPGNSVNVMAGSHTINVPLAMQGSTTFTINTGATLTLANLSGGGGLTTITGGGTLIENAAATNQGNLFIIGANVTVTGPTVTPHATYLAVYNTSNLSINGLLITDGGSLAADSTINLGPSALLETDSANNFYANGPLTGSGSIAIGTGPFSTASSTAFFAGTNSNFSGGITVGGGSTLSVFSDSNLGNASATNTITLNNGTLAATGNFSGAHAVIVTSGGGTLNFPGYNVGLGAVTVTGGGLLAIAPQNASAGVRTITMGSLNISAGSVSLGTAALQTDKTVLVTGGLSLAGSMGAWTTTLDLGGNDMIVQNGSLLKINDQAKQGYAAGTWQGTGGILSAAAAADSTHLTALGVIRNSVDGTASGAVLYPTFDGVTSTNADVLVKYTYYGDANLDGKVDGSDYSRIDNGFMSQSTSNKLSGWFNGDFNYDGVIDGSDYTLIDNAFNSQGAVLSAAVASQISGASAVPEPAALGLLGMMAMGVLGRRRVR